MTFLKYLLILILMVSHPSQAQNTPDIQELWTSYPDFKESKVELFPTQPTFGVTPSPTPLPKNLPALP